MGNGRKEAVELTSEIHMVGAKPLAPGGEVAVSGFPKIKISRTGDEGVRYGQNRSGCV
jgi:hypothetical protein